MKEKLIVLFSLLILLSITFTNVDCNNDKPKNNSVNQDKKDDNDSKKNNSYDKNDNNGCTFWITSSSHKRHNKSCRWYKNSNGYCTDKQEGIACKICGG